MERRFQARLDDLRRDTRVPLGLLRGLAARLDTFLRPFVTALSREEQRENTGRYVRGLLSNLGAKTAEAIAYLHDCDRQGLQKFVGQSPWDHRPLLTELARQVGAELGEPDAVLAFDPSAFAKKGDGSVGVQRQWCGRLGKLENCQVGVYLAYVSRRDHALVDTRLYLPREWTRKRKRMSKAGVPPGVTFRTRHELALDMLDEHGPALPHKWVSGDDELGRCSWFRGALRGRGERYLLAVPSNTSVRDLAGELPAYAGRGRRPRPGSAGRTGGQPVCRPARGRQSRSGTPRRGRWWCRPHGRWSRPGPTTGRRRRPRCWWCSGSGSRTGHGSTTTCSRMPRPIPRWPNSPGCSRPTTGSRSASRGPRARPGWATTRCGRGAGGTTTRPCRWSPLGSSHRKPGGGKKWTPALTVRQVRRAIAQVLHRVVGCDRPARVRRTMERWLRRNEEARFYHWKRRNRLPPRRLGRETQGTQ
jgi:DDE superfamily endonuclease